MKAASRVVLRILTSPLVSPIFRPVMRSHATIFMLHRFRAPELSVHEGIDPVQLRRGLEALRRQRFDIIPLADLLRRLDGRGQAPAGAIAFTIDDGYREQALVAGPAFAAYDCPVTTFATTGFLDGKLWFWWDRIRHVFHETPRTRVQFELNGSRLNLDWENPSERDAAMADVIEACKSIPDQAKHAGIAQLAAAADVALPDAPPPGCEPMTWDELRHCEKHGMSFGPHTVTHPILSRTTDDVSRFELTESWRRLSEQAASPVNVFCYPNGREADFGQREIDTLRGMGFLGAVVGTRGYPGRTDRGDPGAPFRVRRMECPEDARQVVRFASGLERLNLRLRGVA